MNELQVEETNGKEMMDAKHKLQIELQKTEEDLEELKRKHAENREELIARQVELSQLTVLEERKKAHSDKLKDDNERLIKENDKYRLENEQLNKEISLTVQRIDINNLLKHVDLEDVRL
jgi:regulator of replication initiation timing